MHSLAALADPTRRRIVEILAEGEEDAVKELVSWAHHGPSAARVEDVDVRYRSYTGEYPDFRIVE